MCLRPANRTLQLYWKMKYLMIVLRKHPRVARGGYSQLSLSHLPRHTRTATYKNLIHRGTCANYYRYLRDVHREVKPPQFVRFYSSPNRTVFKPEPPIGVLEEPQNSSYWNSLGGRFGQTFNRLSTHINSYFKEDILEAERAGLVSSTPQHLVTSQAQRLNQRGARGKNVAEDPVHESKGGQNSSLTTPSKQQTSELQLFHISSFANRFGESYTYVANHINSVFSRTIQGEERVSPTTGPHKVGKRRKIPHTGHMNSKMSQVNSGSVEQAPVESSNPSGTWEETYLHFARHINNYFGAKGKEKVRIESRQLHAEKNPISSTAQLSSQSLGSTSQLKQEDSGVSETGGLFHSNRDATNFGENHVQMASHINQYFKGQSALDEDSESNDEMLHPPYDTSEKIKTVSFMDFLRHPTSVIPGLLGGPLIRSSNSKTGMMSPGAIANTKLVNRTQAEEIIRGLTDSLRFASSPGALLACVEALNEHLIRCPSSKAVMWQKTAGVLLKKRRTYQDDQVLQTALRETLALMGYVDPVKGCGIRVLSIDGGGTRGVVPLQVLKLLENETGRKIHQLFDYICGVSTGAVLAFMLGLAHFSLEECGEMYRRFGSEVFRQNRLVGTMKMGWSHSYYNTETWERILQEKLGKRVLIKTARDQSSPKVSAVSAVVNWGTTPKAFVFRNYNHKPGSLSRYAGGSGYRMWEAVRASSAAPGYFQEFPLQSDIHQDGGILLNNPCALAVHESRLLWPNQPFQCVLSLGTGRYDNVKRGPATATSLRAKISNLICSATDTEGVHTLLDDLLPPDVYFRFNPMLSAVVSLDESCPGALEMLHRDTRAYLERNRPKVARLCLVLGAERSAVSRSKDWICGRAWEVKQRWV